LPILISENDVISVIRGQIIFETQKGSFAILTSEKEGIEIKDFEADLRNKNVRR
jgi:ligand-binding sensor protein